MPLTKPEWTDRGRSSLLLSLHSINIPVNQLLCIFGYISFKVTRALGTLFSTKWTSTFFRSVLLLGRLSVRLSERYKRTKTPRSLSSVCRGHEFIPQTNVLLLQQRELENVEINANLLCKMTKIFDPTQLFHLQLNVNSLFLTLFICPVKY